MRERAVYYISKGIEEGECRVRGKGGGIEEPTNVSGSVKELLLPGSCMEYM
jgi:hypothetical protein